MNSRNKHRNQLSREDVSQYINTKDERVKQSVERNSSSDAFESDALEGWSENPAALPHLKNLDVKFGIKSNLFLLSSVLGAIGIIGIILFVWNMNSIPAPATTEKVSLTVEQSDVVIPENIDTLESLPNLELIKPITIQKEFKQKIATPETRKQTQNNNESEIKISDLPLIKLDQPKKLKLIETNTAKEIYLSDMKLVDYREYRDRPSISTKTFILSGLPADHEQSESGSTETELSTIEIPYIDYLKKTQSLFAKENYKGALTRYLTILEVYPDDVNALFYSGLCYYNLKQYSSATNQFYHCTIGRFNNFNEEAEWYMAKSYASSGELGKADAIYELIISKNGYYALQAKNALNK